MEKQAFHVEWGRLKIVGNPVMTGAAIGSSQLMRVACRTSPCLVHLFEDSNLVSVWRFPADPIFLLFGPPRRQINVGNLPEESKSSQCSLLVISSDGRVWLLDCWQKYDPSTERFNKEKKEAVPEALQSAVQEILLDESDIKPLYAGKSSQPKQWDNLEHPEIHGSKKPGLLVPKEESIRRAEQTSKKVEKFNVSFRSHQISTNHTSISSGTMDLNSKWKKVSSDAFPRFDNELKVKVVSQEALLSSFPGTLMAAFGPNGSVALLGVSGVVTIIQVRTSDLPQSTSPKSDGVTGRPRDKRESSCLLYASVSTQCNADEQSEGYVALLEAKFFQNLFGCTDNMTSPSGILHGNTKGHLYTSLISPELAVFHTRLLCDFGQPVVAALAVPASSSAKECKVKSERDSTSTKHHCSSLLVIGQLGKVILITGMKETVVQEDNGLFWPTSSSLSWRSKNSTLTERQLTERNFEFCEWEIVSPVAFACMLGPHRLCYCTRFEIFYTDLFQDEDVAHFYPHRSKPKHSTSTELKDSVSLTLFKLSQSLQSSVSQDFRGEPVSEKKLSSQKVPLVDVVVAIAGRGVCGGVGSSRPLVALTARGRLLGVEVSDHVSTRALNIAGGIPRSWRSLLSRLDEKIQGLLHVVGEVSQSTNVIKSHGATITLALNELASALPMAKDICLYEIRTRRPDVSLAGAPLPGKLSSFLTVRDHTSVLSNPGSLSFVPGTAKVVPLTSFFSRKVKIAIRVCNHTRRILSRYWSFLLELRSASSDQSPHYSVPINGGLGLPIGAEYTHEFVAQLPGKGLGPVLICLFLCHHNNPHHLITKSELSLVGSGKTFPHTKGNVFGSMLVESSSSKVGSILKIPGAEITKVVESSQTSGAVCIILSQYRIDFLSLLQVTPPYLGIDTTGLHLRNGENHAKVDASSVHHGQFLGSFSSKLILECVTSSQYAVPKDSAKLWQDLYLDDLLRRGSVSKAAHRICVSAYDCETFMISLKSETLGGKCTFVEVLLESSSLLLGSYLREAILWRLDHCKERFILKECCPWQLTESVKTKSLLSKPIPNADICNETRTQHSAEISEKGSEDASAQLKPTKIIDVIVELEERLGVLLELWGNLLRFPERVQFTSLLDETYAAIQDVLLAYRICRAGEP